MIAFFPSVTKPFRQSRLVKLKPLWTVAIVPSSSFSNPNVFRLSSFLSLSHSRTLITHWISFIHEIFESQSRSFNLSVTDSISQFEAFNRYWFYFSIAISQLGFNTNLWFLLQLGFSLAQTMTRVYIGNLDSRISERDLEDDFHVFGVIRR